MALKAVLDTRFYFTYYSPENPELSRWSRSLIQDVKSARSELFSSTVTISELYDTMGRRLGKEAVKLRIASFQLAGIRFIPVTPDIAMTSGEILLDTPNLPLADSLIAATALHTTNGHIITDDPHFRNVKNVKVHWAT